MSAVDSVQHFSNIFARKEVTLTNTMILEGSGVPFMDETFQMLFI